MSQISHLTKVAVHGVPRSGTSWIGEIVNSSPNTAYRYQPLFSYAHKDFLNSCSSENEISAFFERLLTCEDEFTNQSLKRESGDFPKFEKSQITHVAYKEVRYINILPNMMRKDADVRLLCVIRNPLSVINSWLGAPREFRKDLDWSEMEEWKYAHKKNMKRPEEFNGYEKWKEATNIFLKIRKTYPKRVHITKYSDMLLNPVSESKNIFRLLGLEYTESTAKFIKTSMQSDNHDPYSVYRTSQNDNRWKSELNSEIARQILLDLEGTELENYVDFS